MKVLIVNFLSLLICTFCLSCQNKKMQTKENADKKNLMWFDATANFERFSTKDSIDFYLNKIKELGFTDAVVDVRPITGEVLFNSSVAPQLLEWKGCKRDSSFDFLGTFIATAHRLGLRVHASMNVFVGGHNYLNRGLTYSTNPEWASTVYNPEKGLISIMDEKQKYSAMINPIDTSYQNYFVSLITEMINKYPSLDGVMLDRVRYDGIEADFSQLSKSRFEEYIGTEVENYPTDIYEWVKSDSSKYSVNEGKYFKKWIEWRSKNIYDFMAMLRGKVKQVSPDICFGTYTGAWYPSYYEVGVNFASKEYDPSVDYEWASAEYKNTGYAELMDLYTTGNYYTDITIEEYKKHGSEIWNETDSKAQQGIWYCVEGSCKNLKAIMGDNPFVGGILVDQFYNDPTKLSKSIEMNLKESNGVMLFDIVHIIDKNLWGEVKAGMVAGGAI